MAAKPRSRDLGGPDWPLSPPLDRATATAGLVVTVHGATHLAAVTVDTYNEELRDAEGFIGDRASNRAFAALLDDERERMGGPSADPLGDAPSKDIDRAELDHTLADGDPKAAGLVLGAVEEFAQEFAAVVRRFLRLEAWQDTQRIVVGGGLRASRVDALAIERTLMLLRAHGSSVELSPIRSHPDAAGLVGVVHLVPSRMVSGHDSVLAVDIGGTNLRAGVVALNQERAPDLSQTGVDRSVLWHHRADAPTRDETVERIVGLLREMMAQAEARGRTLAPFIGIGCPGLVSEDGRIVRGGQNLPGNWEDPGLNLPTRIKAAIPEIGQREATVVLHNDAVVQGLSEVPFMRDVERWGVMTIGTGLGNARFSNRCGSRQQGRNPVASSRR